MNKTDSALESWLRKGERIAKVRTERIRGYDAAKIADIHFHFAESRDKK